MSEYGRWKISIPVQVHSPSGEYVRGEGEGTIYAMGQRIEIEVLAHSAAEALSIVGQYITKQIDDARDSYPESRDYD